MSRLHDFDGFQLVAGLASVIAGPVMLVMGAPAGWAFLVMAAGTVVLLALWAIAAEVSFDALDPLTVVLGVAGIICIGIAVVYLTRAADDLPTVFPGFDHDSENFRLIPGVVTLTVGAAALARAFAGVHPTRQHRRGNGM